MEPGPLHQHLVVRVALGGQLIDALALRLQFGE
jgi:hypothetical protein